MLLEFMDYQCPPCKQQNILVTALRKQLAEKLQFSVRHFPLPFHPHAREAAVFAEYSRSKGLFEKVHQDLMGEPVIDTKKIQGIAKKNNLIYPVKDASFSKIVDADLEIIKRLKIDATPTFILCCPDSKVFRLTSVMQIGDFLK
jgi:protein-disulfide isomerase